MDYNEMKGLTVEEFVARCEEFGFKKEIEQHSGKEQYVLTDKDALFMKMLRQVILDHGDKPFKEYEECDERDFFGHHTYTVEVYISRIQVNKVVVDTDGYDGAPYFFFDYLYWTCDCDGEERERHGGTHADAEMDADFNKMTGEEFKKQTIGEFLDLFEETVREDIRYWE